MRRIVLAALALALGLGLWLAIRSPPMAPQLGVQDGSYSTPSQVHQPRLEDDGSALDAPTPGATVQRTTAGAHERGGKLQLLVVDDLGEPLSGVDIEAFFLRHERPFDPNTSELREDEEQVSCMTGSNGRAAAHWSTSGWTHAVVLAVSPSDSDMRAVREEVLASSRHQVTTLTIPCHAAVRAYVFDSEGRPIAWALIQQEGSSRPLGMTDASGSFQKDGLPPGPLTLIAESFGLKASQAVELLAGDITDIELNLPPGAFLVGRIQNAAGEGLPDRPIRISPAHTPAMGLRSDALGEFRTGPLRAGSYLVTGLAVGEFDGMDLIANLGHHYSSQVVLPESGTADVILAPRAGPRPILEGRITRGGEPLAGGALIALAEGESIVQAPSGAQVREDGTFTLQLQQAGQHYLILSPEDKGDFTTHCAVHVPDVGRSDFLWQLPQGRVQVRAHGLTGPVLIDLKPLELPHAMRSLIGCPNQLASQEQTEVEFSDLPPGTYQLSSRGNDRAQSQTFTLGAGEFVVFELRFSSTGYIPLALEGDEPVEIERSTIHIFDLAGRSCGVAAWRSVADESHYDIGPLPPGPVSLYVITYDGRAGFAGGVQAPHPEGAGPTHLWVTAGATLNVQAEREGAPQPATLRIFDETGREVGELQHLGAPLGSAELAPFSSHQARFGPLPEGSYRVLARTSEGEEREAKVRLEAGVTSELVVEFGGSK